MTDELAELARAAGVHDVWVDAAGYRRQAEPASVRAILRSLGLACDSPSQVLRSTARLAEKRRLPPAMLTTWVGSPTRLSFALRHPASFRLTYEDGAVVEGNVFDGDGGHWLPPVLHAGYHELEIAGARMTLAVAPLRACAITDLMVSERRPWGIALRNHAAESGEADFSQLLLLARCAASYGADSFNVGDLHSGDDDGGNQRWLDPARISVSNSFPAHLNAGDGESGTSPTRSVAALRDYYSTQLPRDELLLREFLRFDRDGGEPLKAFALHQVLRELHGDPRGWPAALRNPTPALLGLLGRDMAEAIGFQMFLQWLAERGLRAAQAAARAGGMAIGLIADFTMSSRVKSSDVWADRELMLERLRCADTISSSVAGRIATEVPYNPMVLAERSFQPFIDLLRANMAAVGGLRIRRFDRFWRSWLQRDDASPETGAGLDYPFDDLLRLLVLESVRQRSVVVVEDAERLPERLRVAVEQAGLLCANHFLALDPVEEGDGDDGDNEDLVRSEPSAVYSSGRVGQSLLNWWRGDDIQRLIHSGEFSTMVATRELALRERERVRLLSRLGIERRQTRRKPLRERREPLRSVIASPLDDAARDRRFEEVVVNAALQRLGGMTAPMVFVDLDDLVGISVSTSLAELDACSLSRLLDASTVRNRLNRLDEGRRYSAICSANRPEQAKSA